MSDDPTPPDSRAIPDHDRSLYPTFFTLDENGERTAPVKRELAVELRGDQFWVEPADGCGVLYVFPFAELEAVIAEAAAGYEPGPEAFPDRQMVPELQVQVEQAEQRAVQAEARRDDSEARITAVVEWAREKELDSDLEDVLGNVVTKGEEAT